MAFDGSGERNYRGYVRQEAVVFGPTDEVLLVRSTVDRPWSLSCGRVQDGESADEAVAREIREETGLSVEVRRPVRAVTGAWHTGSGEPMFAVVYACDATERDVELNREHEEYEWVPSGRRKNGCHYWN